jgi:hypothetical protein
MLEQEQRIRRPRRGLTGCFGLLSEELFLVFLGTTPGCSPPALAVNPPLCHINKSSKIKLTNEEVTSVKMTIIKYLGHMHD